MNVLAYSQQRPQRIVLSLFAVSLVLRLGYLVVHGPSVAADTQTYFNQAHAILGQPGAALGALAQDTAPLFTLLLALFVPFGGAAAPAFLVTQAIAGAAIAPLVAQLASYGWGWRRGFFAGLVAALTPDFMFWSTYVLTETMFLLLLLAVGIQFARSPTARRPVLSGLGLAGLFVLALLGRRAAFLLGAALPIGLLACLPGARVAAVKAFLGFVAPFLVVAAAVLSFNVISAGRPVPAREVAQVSSALWFPVWVGIQWNEVGRATDGVDLHYPANYDSLSPTDKAALLEGQSLDFIRAHPTEFAWLGVRKAVVFWEPALPEWSSSHRLIAVITLVPLYLLALAGLFARPDKPGSREFAFVVLVSFTLTAMLTFVDYDQRYRLPAMIAISMLAGVGVHNLTERAQVWISGRAKRPSEERAEMTEAAS